MIDPCLPPLVCVIALGMTENDITKFKPLLNRKMPILMRERQRMLKFKKWLTFRLPSVWENWPSSAYSHMAPWHLLERSGSIATSKPKKNDSLKTIQDNSKRIRIWGLGGRGWGVGGIFNANFKKRVTQQPRWIILPHFRLEAFKIHFGKPENSHSHDFLT